jgi:hypothetical protein
MEGQMKYSISKSIAALTLAAGLVLPGVSFAQTATGVSVPAGTKTATSARHSKIDCDQVMSELNTGKKQKEVAADMKISVSSVSRCKKKEKLASKEKKTGMSTAPAAPTTATKTK